MKYIDVDKLRAEIERRKKQDLTFRERNILIDIEMAIDSLQQEQPEVDLEEAARKYRFFDFGTPDEIAQTAFKAGAEWQKEQMMKEDGE